MNILLTGGRAPATLDLARTFHRAGHTVFMAESLRGHLSQPSNAIKANFIVPAPRQNPEAFFIAIKNIVIENKIDLLVPTCEEIFYVAMRRDEIPCTVFTEPLKKLDALHNKWNFVINAVQHGLHIPETMLVRTEDDLLHAFAQWRGLVLKPIYSRFASRTMILPPLKKALSTLKFDAKKPWVAQEYIPGKLYSSYSVCHNGRITAHASYPAKFTVGEGQPTIAFQHEDNPAIFWWVKTFVENNQFTGQIAFDLIQTPEGQIYGIECNPRATSGVHLLAAHPKFIEAFINPDLDCVTPLDNRSHILSAAMLFYALPPTLTNGQFMEWLKTFLGSDDVVLNFKDPLPFLFQLRSLLATRAIASREKISMLEASTFDIEWNGEV